MEKNLKEGKSEQSPLDVLPPIPDTKRVLRVKYKDDRRVKRTGKMFFKINRRTLPLKIILFLYYGAMSAVLPYLTIHMKDIGISLSQIAIIYATLPFTAFLGPPIMGFLADKFGQYKSVLVVSTILNGIFHTFLLLVPKYNETLIYSSAVIEFQGAAYGGAIMLKPKLSTECDSFYQSLVLSSERGENLFRNKIINVSNCSKTVNESLQLGGPFSRGIPVVKETPISMDGLEICQMETSEDINSTVILGYTCADIYSPPDFPHDNKIESKFRRKRAEISTSSKKCSLSVTMNSANNNVSASRDSFTCQTNYTFPLNDKIKEGNGSLTFWLYFLIRVIGNIFMNACFSLLDATTLAIVGSNEGAEYGRERILCTIGYAVISPLAGFIVDRVSDAKGYTDYSAAFYLANSLLLLNVICYFFMELEVEKPEENIWKNAADLLNYPEVVLFLGMIFIMGNMWGFVESYLFIFLDELNAPKYLLGLTLTVGSLAGIPFLYGAEKMVAKAGRINIIVLAFLVYFIRFFGYSYIPNPFWCFPFEAMEALTYHLMWVSAATYCAVLAPKGLLATLTGVMGSLHYGLGKGSGAFIGGYLIKVTSTRLSFRLFGIFAGITGIFYFLIDKFWLDRHIKKRNQGQSDNLPDQKDQTKSMIDSGNTSEPV